MVTNGKCDIANESHSDVIEKIGVYLTTRDLERLLKVDKRTLARLWQDGIIPYPSRIGGSNRWRAKTIAAVLDSIDRMAAERREKTDALKVTVK